MSDQPIRRVSAPQDKDGDCPECDEKERQQRRGTPVRQIGRQDPPEMQPDQQGIGDFVKEDAQKRLMLDPSALKDAPPWALQLMNEVRALHIEVMAYGLAMMRRGLITDPEINQAREEIVMEANKAFREMVDQLGRGFKQAPAQPAPDQGHDPRRSPGGGR